MEKSGNGHCETELLSRPKKVNIFIVSFSLTCSGNPSDGKCTIQTICLYLDLFGFRMNETVTWRRLNLLWWNCETPYCCLILPYHQFQPLGYSSTFRYTAYVIWYWYMQTGYQPDCSGKGACQLDQSLNIQSTLSPKLSLLELRII